MYWYLGYDVDGVSDALSFYIDYFLHVYLILFMYSPWFSTKYYPSRCWFLCLGNTSYNSSIYYLSTLRMKHKCHFSYDTCMSVTKVFLLKFRMVLLVLIRAYTEWIGIGTRKAEVFWSWDKEKRQFQGQTEPNLNF